MVKLDETLSKASSSSPNVILCGDFNLPHLSWPDGNITTEASGEEKEMINALKDFMNEFYLTQCIYEPTHQKGNTLDLLLTNN